MYSTFANQAKKRPYDSDRTPTRKKARYEKRSRSPSPPAASSGSSDVDDSCDVDSNANSHLQRSSSSSDLARYLKEIEAPHDAPRSRGPGRRSEGFEKNRKIGRREGISSRDIDFPLPKNTAARVKEKVPDTIPATTTTTTTKPTTKTKNAARSVSERPTSGSRRREGNAGNTGGKNASSRAAINVSGRLASSGATRKLDPEDRVHYDPVKLMHEPVYAHARSQHEKALKKIEAYDSLAETKKRRKRDKLKESKTGAQKLEELKYWLDNLGIERQPHQVKFHEQMILASLNKIYEKEWETQYEAIMKTHNIDKMKRELFLSCPRRWGKTYSVAIFVAAFILAIPGCRVAVFSTGKRTAKKLMVLILSFLVNYPGFPERVTTKNQEDLVLSFSLNDDRTLSCYPSSVKVRIESNDSSSTRSSVRLLVCSSVRFFSILPFVIREHRCYLQVATGEHRLRRVSTFLRRDRK